MHHLKCALLFVAIHRQMLFKSQTGDPCWHLEIHVSLCLLALLPLCSKPPISCVSGVKIGFLINPAEYTLPCQKLLRL